ncbi:hypothetical protein TUM4438_15510 [Shewanella sairae]|uniref:DUF58 domain-containing protein n=1 Tax=Shewanella sairae TaxID=190310 RepID=A0ABQ4PAG6_9GAMM|nr:DUF58 domain-containing protein [Shewanella sairae]MCL1128227.1 DUF58 domain-containing protein [Shewanella sairae]GIU44402.1 hypothetical protein TUM4438_15510 [Shewanella sairae]
MVNTALPLFSDGIHITEKELLACQSLAKALPEKRSKAKASLAGHRASLIKGRGMEFAEVRHYQSGDDVRTIDWRVTARTGKAHTKLFVEERERPVLILLDLSSSLYFGSSLMLQSVQAAHLATTLGWSAIMHGDRLGALIATEQEHIELKPRSRQQGILQVIAAIKKLHQNQLQSIEQPPEPQHMVKACQRLRRLAKPGSLIWIISDGSHLNSSCLATLSDLKRHCDIGAFLVTDPLRQGKLTLPKHFQLPVKEGGKEQLLDRHSYEKWLISQHQLQNSFIEMMQKLNVQTRMIDSGIRLNQQLEALR